MATTGATGGNGSSLSITGSTITGSTIYGAGGGGSLQPSSAQGLPEGTLKVGDKVSISLIPTQWVDTRKLFPFIYHGVVEGEKILASRTQVVWVRTVEPVPPDHPYRWQQAEVKTEQNDCLYVFASWCELGDRAPEPVSPHVMGLDPEEIDQDAFREFMKGM